MRIFKKLQILSLLLILLACATQKKSTKDVIEVKKLNNSVYNKQNHREYKEQELIYYEYTLERKCDTRKGIKSVKVEPVVKKKEELIKSINSKGVKPSKFIKKIINKRNNIDSVNINEGLSPIENIEKSNKSNFKSKFRTISSLTLRFVSYTYFILLAIFNFPLFTIVFPTTICAIGCICYPIWWKRGYLDTPYAKIATFIAAYGGLLANILWIILYL